MSFCLYVRATIVAATLFAFALEAHAQELCSDEGKTKLRRINISESQIVQLCSDSTLPTTNDHEVYYTDLKSALLDADDAIGRTIYLKGTYRKLQYNPWIKKTEMKVRHESEEFFSWDVEFDSNHRNTVASLREDQKISMICRITDLSLGRCSLLHIDLN